MGELMIETEHVERIEAHNPTNTKRLELEFLAAILVELRRLNEPKGFKQRLKSLFGR